MRTGWILFLCATTACGTPLDESHPPATADAAGTQVAAPERAWEQYGETFVGEEFVSASALLADPSAYVDKTLLVEGRVADVCQEKGCWMVITDEERHMRVIMKDHAYGVNKKATGWDCQVKGTLVATRIDPETVAHYASESSEGAVVPEKAVQGDTTYEFVADGVRMCPPAG
ncbi:MAG: DUF4920 domain-containing protein [Deltaproteobacteria bacterium]|nr:DUF4920 domain-containing protein [Deltaproteobacteria bacterium]